MKGNDEITGLFRSRLSGAEMTVRDGFWEELKGDLSRVETDATNTSAATKKDNGIGINKEFQKHIFEEFTREESSTVSGIQGTGQIGRASCRERV